MSPESFRSPRIHPPERITTGRLSVWQPLSGHAKPRMTRTSFGATFSLKTFRPDTPKPRRGPYRNPLIFARELHEEMLRHNLTRVQLGQRHGITSDRITQWLCLFKLPEEKQQEIEALGDHWDQRVVTEGRLREKGP